MAQQVSPSQMRALVPPDLKPKVASIMRQPGMGCAFYTDGANAQMLMSYGTYQADLPGRYCPGYAGTRWGRRQGGC